MCPPDPGEGSVSLGSVPLFDGDGRVRVLIEQQEGIIVATVFDKFERVYAVVKVPLDGDVTLHIFDLNGKVRLAASEQSDGTPLLMMLGDDGQPLVTVAPVESDVINEAERRKEENDGRNT